MFDLFLSLFDFKLQFVNTNFCRSTPTLVLVPLFLKKIHFFSNVGCLRSLFGAWFSEAFVFPPEFYEHFLDRASYWVTGAAFLLGKYTMDSNRNSLIKQAPMSSLYFLLNIIPRWIITVKVWSWCVSICPNTTFGHDGRSQTSAYWIILWFLKLKSKTVTCDRRATIKCPLSNTSFLMSRKEDHSQR